MITVFGRLLASFFDAQAEPVPVTGRVLFTPNFTSEHTAEGVHLPTRLSVKLDGEGRFEARLLAGDWSWRVEVIAKDQTERTLTVPCFNFLPEPGVSQVAFSDIVPVADPVTGVPMLRGEDGVGVSAITTAGGELIFTLTNGSETRIPVPQGIPGTGVEGITLEGDELVFTLSDGSETRLPAPAGAPGKDAPKPNLAVGEVQTLPAGASATAEVTGMSPDFVLSLGVPAGANGATPTITAGTVSTLPAGASATAELTPTTGGYALNLGLPAGKNGEPGANAPTPTLTVGTVTTGTAAASITGTAPNFVLNLTLPAPFDTGWRTLDGIRNLPSNVSAGWDSTKDFLMYRIIGDQCHLYLRKTSSDIAAAAWNAFSASGSDLALLKPKHPEYIDVKISGRDGTSGHIFQNDDSLVNFVYTGQALAAAYKVIGRTQWTVDRIPEILPGTPR